MPERLNIPLIVGSEDAAPAPIDTSERAVALTADQILLILRRLGDIESTLMAHIGTAFSAKSGDQPHPFIRAAMVGVVDGAPSDEQFVVPPPDGSVLLDTTNHRIYFRSAGAWKYAALT